MAGERTRYPLFTTVRQNLTRWLNNWSELQDIYYRCVETPGDRHQWHGLIFTRSAYGYVDDVHVFLPGVVRRTDWNTVRLDRENGLRILFGDGFTRITSRRYNPLLISPRLIAEFPPLYACIFDNQELNTYRVWLSVFTDYKLKCVRNKTDGVDALLVDKRGRAVESEPGEIEFVWSPEKRRFVLW